MTQAKSKSALTETTTSISVFGSKPERGIFFPNMPFSVRNDCQIGQWKVGDKDFRGDEIELSIIRVASFYGILGKTKLTNWQQIWFVPAPTCQTLPKNTVCVTYLKTRSIAQFSQRVIELMESGDPARGIFSGSFKEHSGEMGTYYSVVWSWRERETKEEIDQLEDIAGFLKMSPQFYDPNNGDLICIEGMPQDDIDLLVARAKAEDEE